MNAKRCSKCAETRALDMFRADRRNRDLLQSNCKLCQRDTYNRWRLQNKDEVREKQRAWDAAHKDQIAAARQVWLSNNKERVAAIKRKWADANREKRRAYDRMWQKANPAKKCATTRQRQAAIIQRTPSWLTNDHIEEMCDFYEAARMFRIYTGQEYHVDHIVPLQGDHVSGLHVPWNLQVMLARDNLRKNNKFTSDHANKLVTT